MGFDAGDVVEPLDWTFVKITKDDADQGTVPEPTDKAIDKLFRAITRLTTRAVRKANENVQAFANMTPETVMEGLAEIPDDLVDDFGLEEMLSELNNAYAELCQNQPSAAQLAKLPMRIRMRFFNWLQNELRPNGFGGASMNPAPVNGQHPDSASRTAKPA